MLNFATWLERHGAGLPEREARRIWNAALESAHETLCERSHHWREKNHSTGDDIDSEHAAVRQVEARMCASNIYILKG